ncbi:hypothetical protein [Micromonospora sp. NPDC048898]|uniref:hypothetical protein n=1 Tax=Micromonospora sp. NPDC048898 TaxID=3364260 RepID=UPI0037214247
MNVTTSPRSGSRRIADRTHEPCRQAGRSSVSPVVLACQAVSMANGGSLAVVLSIGALVVAGASLLVSVLTYRRGGARVRAYVHTAHRKLKSGREVGVLAATIINEGYGAVQLRGASFGFIGRPWPKFMMEGTDGPDFPIKLEGHHAETVWVPIASCLREMDHHRVTEFPFQVVFALGSGRAVFSTNRCTIPLWMIREALLDVRTLAEDEMDLSDRWDAIRYAELDAWLKDMLDRHKPPPSLGPWSIAGPGHPSPIPPAADSGRTGESAAG